MIMKKIIALLLAIGLGQMAPVMAMYNGQSSSLGFDSLDLQLQDDLREQLSSQGQQGFQEGIGKEYHSQYYSSSASSDLVDRESADEEEVLEDYEKEFEPRTYRDVVREGFIDYKVDGYEIKNILKDLSRCDCNSSDIQVFLATKVQEQNDDMYQGIVDTFTVQFCEKIKDQYSEEEKFVLTLESMKKLNDTELKRYYVKEMVKKTMKELLTLHYDYLDMYFFKAIFNLECLTSESVNKIIDNPRAYGLEIIVQKRKALKGKYLDGSEQKELNRYEKFLSHNLDKVSLSEKVSSPSNNIGFASLGVAAASLTKDVMASYNKEVKKLLAEKQQQVEQDKKIKGKRITLTSSEKARCALAMLAKHTNPKNIKANKMFWAAAVVALGSLLYTKASCFKMPTLPTFGSTEERDDYASDSHEQPLIDVDHEN